MYDDFIKIAAEKNFIVSYDGMILEFWYWNKVVCYQEFAVNLKLWVIFREKQEICVDKRGVTLNIV